MKTNIIDKIIKYLSENAFQRRRKSNKIKANQTISETMAERHKRHYMRCPNCDGLLKEIDHKAIKIDKCQQCDGTWLEAGKLETALQNEKTVIENIYRTFMQQLY